MSFDELAALLGRAYIFGYADRDTAMRNFGNEHEADLRRLMEREGRAVFELADAAKIGDFDYWAGYIREGMGMAVQLSETHS